MATQRFSSAYKEAWTPERKQAFSDYMKQKYIDCPELKENLSAHRLGVPKTEIQKQRMSEAKLGVAKSPEHAKAMSNAQKLRHKVVTGVQEEHGMSFKEACKELKSNKEYYYAKYS